AIAGQPDRAARYRRGAADALRLLRYQDLQSLDAGRQCGRHAAGTGAGHDEVHFPVPFHAAEPPSDLPPSTNRTCPVMKSVRVEARKATAFATSSGRPALPVGCKASCAASRSGVSWRSRGVSMRPGATALTRIPRDASSIAAARVKPATAALEAT